MSKSLYLSPNFSLDELTISETADRLGLDNTPKGVHLENLKATAQKMEVVRQLLGNNVIIVSSGYRSPAVNEKVGGSKTSDHSNGYAVDFICPRFGSPYEVCTFLATQKEVLQYDQLIHEFRRWTHISFAPRRRKQDLSIFKKDEYLLGIRK